MEPGRQKLATGGDNGAIIWDPATGEQLRLATGPGDSARSVAWSPDGTELAAGGDNGAIIWDPATGEQLRELTAAGNWTTAGGVEARTAQSLLPAGTAACSSATRPPANSYGSCSSPCLVEQVPAVAWSPDGTKLATAGWGKLKRHADLGPGHRRTAPQS